MGYRLEWRPSPNFTPGSQTRALYGRPRTIELGAGHWWDDPSRGPSHDGVVNTFLNPARQASAHAVVSAGRVTEMVNQNDTSWCTNSANPYTFSIECDPRITQGGATAEAIMKTLTEYIADKGFHNLVWRPHKFFFATACNPIDWNEVMRRAKIERTAKDTPAAPAVKEVARQVYDPVKKFVVVRECILENIPNGGKVGDKIYKNNEQVDIKQRLTMSDGSVWYRTPYSSDNELATGFRDQNIDEYIPTPEWEANLVDVEDVKLMVLPAEGTQVVNLKDGKAITPLAKGTWVDIAKRTTVGGKVYLISKYSVDNALPNGIFQDHLGVPVEPPKVEKPEWLLKWEDIEDVKMYLRVKAPLVNLIDGSTIKDLDMNTPFDVASTTEWHGQKYAISKYSTDKGEARGIALAHLDKDPIKQPEVPAEPVTEKTPEELIKENNSILKKILEHFGIK